MLSSFHRRMAVLSAAAALLGTGSLAFADEAAAAPTIAEVASKLDSSAIVANTVWTLIAGMLVFFMNAGFGMLETGLCRRKNAVHILAKNFIVFAVSSIAFWVVGFGFMFGGEVGADGTIAGTKWLGLTGFLPSLIGDGSAFPGLSWANVPEATKFFFQLVFAGTAATIVSGVVAERIKFASFMIFSFLLVAFVYPVTGHWIWGGGFLGGLETPVHDFAGSTVVHSVGGWAALAGVLLLGPRLGKYAGGKAHAMPGHNMGLAALGTLILWLGWFGFNPGSTMGAVEGIGYIAVTTNTAAAFGAVLATITAWIVLGKPDLSMILNGCLAGLVAVTAPCAVVSIGGAAIIGGVAGILVVLSVLFWDKIRIDDPVGALSVHLVCGIWGTLAVGLFAAPDVIALGLGVSKPGLFYGGGTAQLMSQLIGIVTVGAFVMVASLIFWALIKFTIGIRVSAAEEEEGLDIGEHGMEAYPGFALGSEMVGSNIPDLGDAVPAVTPGQRRFSVVVEGPQPKDLIGAWTELCGAPAPSPDFKSVYPYVTTVQGNKFRFRGGDPGAMADSLKRLFQSALKGNVNARLDT